MGAVGATRRAVLTGAAALTVAARLPAAPRTGLRLRSGLDRLLADPAPLLGQHVALLTHDAARTAQGQRGVDAIAALPGAQLGALFAPEHGLSGAAAAGAHVGDLRDPATGLPVFSLYGARKAPEPAQLAGIDLLLIDLQDVGLRCFTYAGTALAAIAAAARAGVKVMVLDRPNPLGGVVVEGPLAEPGWATPVTALPVPYRHGLTLGELVRWQAPTTVVSRLDGWRRDMGTAIWGAQALPFTPPSPNLRSPAAVLAYAATVLIEGTNLSEGRGSDAPFELIGAPWIDALRLTRAMTAARLPGVRFTPAHFTPATSKHAGKLCQGLRLTVTDQHSFRGLATGLELIARIRRLHPAEFRFLPGNPPYIDLLAGRSWLREWIEAGRGRGALLTEAEREARAWAEENAAVRLY